MSVTVHEAREIPTKERGGAQHSQVRLMLLPTRKTKHRTKIRSGDDNPKFEETFMFKVPPGQFFTSDKKEVYVLPVLSVCLSVCEQDYSKRRAWIWMKCCVSTDVGTWTN